jgi:arylsulfatase A-like enzyme
MADFKEYRNSEIMPVPDSIPVLKEWRPFVDPARIWLNADRLPSAYHEGDGWAAWTAKKSIEFIRENKANRFCLWVGFHEPHSPFNFPVEYRNIYDPADMPLPAGSPEDDRWVPEIFRDLSEADKRGIIASYYTSVEYMDHCIGLILDELELLGLAENTLLIYIGDQGYLLGDHKRFEKHTMWEPAIRAPLIMRMGGRYGTGVRHDALTEFIDLAPTMLDLLGVEAMPGVQGKSLLPLLGGEQREIREYAFAEFLEDNKAMICNHQWKYVFTTGQRDLGQGYATGYGPSGVLHKLYNLTDDPDETTDLGKDTEHAEIVTGMQRQMLNRFMVTHPDARNLPEGLSIEEKLIWFCEPRDIGSEPGQK